MKEREDSIERENTANEFCSYRFPETNAKRSTYSFIKSSHIIAASYKKIFKWIAAVSSKSTSLNILSKNFNAGWSAKSVSITDTVKTVGAVIVYLLHFYSMITSVLWLKNVHKIFTDQNECIMQTDSWTHRNTWLLSAGWNLSSHTYKENSPEKAINIMF